MADLAKIGAFVQSSPYPTWLTTSKGDCIYGNSALERLTGLNSDQIKQADWRSFLQEEDRAAATTSWQRSLATGTPYRLRARMQGCEGVSMPVELIAFGHKLDDGPELWLFTGLRENDATQQRLPSEAQIQATLNVIPAYCWYALPSGALTFVNERTADYLGLPKDHPLRFGIDVGASWDFHIPLLHPDDHDETRRVWSTCLRTRCAGEVNFRVRNAEGGYRWFLSRAEPLRTSDGILLYWIGVNLDIDDAKRAENALSRSEKQLRDMIDTIPATVWSALPDGSNTYVNRRFIEYSGMSADQAAGSGWQAATHPDDLERHTGKWMEAVATGKPHENEVRFRRSDGQYRWHLDRGVALRDKDGNILKWYGVLTDIEDRKRAEQALQRSEDYLSEAQRLSHTGSWAWSPATDNTYYSEECYRVLGFTPGDGVPPPLETIIQRIHPDDQARCRERVEKGVRDKVDFELDYRIVHPDKNVRDIHCLSHPVLDPSGNLVELVGTVIDITERKRAEEALQRSRFYINEGQRLAHMGSWAFNPLGFFDYWSDELFQIYGLDPKKGAPTLEQYLATLHPQDRDSMAETIKTMHLERCGCDVKKRIVRPDGQPRYIRCVGIPVIKNEVLKGFLGTAIDITEQELLTEELERQRAYLTEAQKLTHTGSWVWRVADRSAVYLSDEWYRIYHFNPAEGPPPWEKRLERVHPEDRPKWKGTIESAIVEKTDYDVEFRILLPSGATRWIYTVGHPVLSEAGDLEQFVGSSTDITERKSAEQERERLHHLEADLAHINRVSMLGEMAASLAHEIKQPIAAAITSANTCMEWLAHEPPNLDRARAAAARIDKYGNRAAQIIDHIRSLYKKAPSQRELVDVNGIVQEIFTLVQDEAIRYSIIMHPNLATDLPKVDADRVQLQQVFMNLMINAIESMQESGGELTVNSQLQNGQLLFSISDTGSGLPTDNMDQIFSAFYTTKQQGSGMGLAISRTIVESHGGRLWATSNERRGATFHFTLPTPMTKSSRLAT